MYYTDLLHTAYLFAKAPTTPPVYYTKTCFHCLTSTFPRRRMQLLIHSTTVVPVAMIQRVPQVLQCRTGILKIGPMDVILFLQYTNYAFLA